MGDAVKAFEGKFWLELREPRCVPQRKGPWSVTMKAKILREFMAARPTAYITVVTISHDGPDFDDGPQELQMTDARSMSTGSAHIRRTREAHDGIREALAPATGRAEGRWRPIDTAPKDEQPILLALDRGRYGDISRAPVVGYWKPLRGWVTWHEPLRVIVAGPTHWRPLPAPPAGRTTLSARQMGCLGSGSATSTEEA